MPITYQRDDARRRIVVTTIGIVGLDDMLAVADRQAGEGTWRYGVLYDSRRVASVASQTDARTGLAHVRAPRTGRLRHDGACRVRDGADVLDAVRSGAPGGRGVPRYRGCRTVARRPHGHRAVDSAGRGSGHRVIQEVLHGAFRERVVQFQVIGVAAQGEFADVDDEPVDVFPNNDASSSCCTGSNDRL